FGQKPRDSAFYGWLAIMAWATAVEKAGSLYPPDVVKSLETFEPIETPAGKFTIRAEDHQGIVNFPIMRGKKKADMKDANDWYEIIEVVDGSTVAPELGVLGCKMGD